MFRTRLLDASVIYSYTLRDFFITLGTMGLRVRWSDRIAEEFVAARGRGGPDQASRAREVHALMRRAVPDWRATASARHIASLVLPDPDDRHVLAAAIACRADIIVTDNRRDFPAHATARHGVIVQSPDEALSDLFDQDSERMVEAAAAMRARMRDPALTASEWLERLARARCPATARRLETEVSRL